MSPTSKQMLGVDVEDGLGGGTSLGSSPNPCCQSPSAWCSQKEAPGGSIWVPCFSPSSPVASSVHDFREQAEALQCHLFLYSLLRNRQRFEAVSEVPTLETPSTLIPLELGCRSVEEHLPSDCRALGSISTTDRKRSHAPLIPSVFLHTDIHPPPHPV